MQRVLIVGCGDVGLLVAERLAGRRRLFALTHTPERMALLRARGLVPIAGDLDRRASLGRIGGLADAVVHLAPPPSTGRRDQRTANLLAALARPGMLPQRLVYISTTGVYGDCRGERVPETRPRRPQSERAARRVDAEDRLRAWGARNRVSVAILRVPGIYGPQRLPIARLQAGTPALAPEDDGYSNHIHIDDLAAAVVAALARGRPQRAYNTADGSELKTGEYFDRVADRFGLPRPPRVRRAEADGAISPALLSFMDESRRVVSERMRRELRLRLAYPTVDAALADARLSPGADTRPR
ncbi:MAG TPA: NAD-dependent epimerase/dehydratase family protein [Pelomicrobium sp.]|nr:NAD-dependent epimerase/dehydratase family protein [Pelomicrobium sp.]